MDTNSINIIQLAGEYENALLMVWSKQPTHKNVTLAFNQIRGLLDNATSTVHCIVDLRLNPSFPLAATFNGALELQSHRNMGKWLVLGGNATAKFIGRAIVSVVHNNIEWLDTEDDAYQLLGSLIMHNVNNDLGDA